MLTNPVSKIFVVLAVLTAAFVTLSFVNRADPSYAVNNAEAYQIYRREEVKFPLSFAEAYRLFRLGEWATVEITDLSAYRQSERNHVPVRNLAAFNAYQRSEWFGE
jgi:hypothetical protein